MLMQNLIVYISLLEFINNWPEMNDMQINIAGLNVIIDKTQKYIIVYL